MLRDWVTVTEDASLDEDGHASGHLRFTRGADVVHWRLTAQEQLHRTRTDFTFTRADGPHQSVKVYLEGFEFHASRRHNRIAADARQRTMLRADGHVVFEITWADIDLFEQRPTPARPAWPPYSSTAQEQAKDAYEQYGGQRAQFAGAVFVNPITALIGYLREPDNERWALRAAAMVTGLLAAGGTTPVAVTSRRDDLINALRSELGTFGERQAVPPPLVGGTSSPVHVYRSNDLTGLPIVVTLDTADSEHLRWSALAVLDDSDAVLDTDAHKDRWRSWLYWTNLTQFLAFDDGDGVQLAYSTAADYDVEMLAVCGGLGELNTLSGARAVSAPTAGTPHSSPTVPAQRRRDPSWDEDILEILRDEPNQGGELGILARQLAERGKRAPVFGYELGTSRWMVDFAWTESNVKVAVVYAADESDHDALRRDEAYVEDGWTLLTASEWLGRFDELVALLPDVEDPTL